MSRKEQKEDWEQLDGYIDGNLPPAGLDEETLRAVDLLRQEAESVNPAPDFVNNLSTRLAAKAGETPPRPSLAAWLTLKLVPRLLAAGAAVVAVVLLLTWLPYLWPEARQLEPSLPDSNNLATTGQLPGLDPQPLLLPDVPAALPRYRLLLEPLPETAEAAVAWARAFGLADPEAFHEPRDPLLVYVIGRDGEELTFHRAAAPGGIYYNANKGQPDSPGVAPLSPAAAAAVAVTFLQERNLLPEAYLVQEEPQAGEWSRNLAVRRIHVSPDLAGYPLRGSVIAPVASLQIGPEGDVLTGYFNLVEVTAGEPVAVRPAQEVLAAFKAGTMTPFRLETRPLGAEAQPQYFLPPPPEHRAGEPVTIVGRPMLLTSADGQRTRASVRQLGAIYELSGPALFDMVEQASGVEVTVQGTIVAALSADRWQVEVTAWSPAATPPYPVCFNGMIERAAAETWLVAGAGGPVDAGTRFRIPRAPVELLPDDPVQVCTTAPLEPEQDLPWLGIVSPPPSESVAYGSSVVVSEAVEVTRVVPETPVAESAVLPATGSSERSRFGQSPSLALRPGTVQSPYTWGEAVVVTGVLKGAVYRSGRDERLEVTLHAGPDDDGIWYNYPLLGDDGLLSQMAYDHHNLHVTVSGVIEMVMGDYGERQAIAVESYSRTWPEERIEAFLGSVSLESVAGEEVAVFTDRVTGQRYVYGDRYFGFHDWDPVLQEELVWVAGVVHPVATFAGLPLLRLIQTTWGSSVERATSAAVLPLPAGPDVAPELRPGSPVQDSFIVERIELVYYFEPQYDNADPRQGLALLPEQWAEPVWLLHGRDAAGSLQFTAYVWATLTDG